MDCGSFLPDMALLLSESSPAKALFVTPLAGYYTAPFTLSIWFYLSSNCSTWADGLAQIFSLYKRLCSTFALSWIWRIQVQNVGGSNGLYFYIVDNTPASIGFAADSFLTAQTWYNVIITVTAGRLCKMYLNGSVQSGSVTPPSINTSPTAIMFGVDPSPIWTDSGQTYRFNGILDDARIYDRVLTQAEISTIFGSRGCDKILYGLVGRWRMFEKNPGVLDTYQGTFLKDYTTNKNTGTMFAFNRGKDTTDDTDDSGNPADLWANPVSLTATGATIQSISFYVKTVYTPNPKMYLGLYDESGGNPNNKVAETAEFTINATGWWTRAVVTPADLVAGNYWLVYTYDTDKITFRKVNTGPWKRHDRVYGPLPASFGTVDAEEPDQASFAMYARFSSKVPAYEKSILKFKRRV